MNNKKLLYLGILIVMVSLVGCKRDRNNIYDPINITDDGDDGNPTNNGASYRTVLFEEFTGTW